MSIEDLRKTEFFCQIKPLIDRIEQGNNAILIGSGGTAKSASLRVLAHYFRMRGKVLGITAATGIASINLSIQEQRAKTLHSWAGVGLAQAPAEKLLSDIQKYKPNPGNIVKNKHDRWLKTDILIIDEISMIGKELLTKLDFIGRNIRLRMHEPFGGIILVISGDWMQLPPVKDEWCFTYSEWPKFKLYPFIFRSPLRFQKSSPFLEKKDEDGEGGKGEEEKKGELDLAYFEMLLKVREGVLDEKDKPMIYGRIKAYNDWLGNPANHQLNVVKPTVLYPLKADVSMYNKRELDRLPSESIMVNAHDNFLPLKFSHWTPKQWSDRYSTYLDDMIPKTVELKVGAQVMLKFNIDFEAGLVNGSRGLVTKMLKKMELDDIDLLLHESAEKESGVVIDTEEIAIVEVLFKNGITSRIRRIPFKYEDDDISAKRFQIPLILAWCVTIHSSQGSTIDYAICDIGPQIFAYGQAYVSLSRVKNLDGLLLSNFVEHSIKCDPDALRELKAIEKNAVEIKLTLDALKKLPSI